MPLISRIGAGAARGFGLFIGKSVDAFFEYVTLLLSGNGTNGAQNNTFLDSSTNNFTITRNGNTTQGTFSPFSQTGWSNYFDGTGDRLSLATATALGTGSNTVEFWFFPTDASATYRSIYDGRSTTGTDTGYGIFQYGLTIEVYGNGLKVATAATAFNANNWVHVALVRNSGTCQLYINGVASGASATYSANLTSTVRTIGDSVNTGFPFVGYVSNLREVTSAVYTSNFTPPAAPLTAITNTSLLTCQSNRFIDNSSNAFAITRNGDVSVQPFSPFNPTAAWSAATYGGSGYFDGSGDYLSIGSGANNFALSGDFCVEAWIYRNANTDGTIIGNYNSSPNRGWSFRSFISNNLYMYFQIDGGAEIIYTTGVGTLPLSAWSHVVWCRSGTNTSVYINGTRADNRTLSGTSIGNGGLSVSALSQSRGDVNFNGYIANARLVNGSSVYDPSQSTITVPTSPLTAVTNTQALLNFTNAGIFDATAKNDLETVGNAQISTTQSKFGGSSMYFDGAGDGLRQSTSQNLNWYFGSGNMTIECWAYFNSVAGYQTLLDFRGAAFGNSSFVLWIDAGTLSFYAGAYSVAAPVISGGSISTGQWYHITVSRFSGTTKLFLNGIQTATTANAWAQTFSSTDVLSIGASSNVAGNFLNGYIDDLRITKGIARYTSNFTPPTTAFPLQ